MIYPASYNLKILNIKSNLHIISIKLYMVLVTSNPFWTFEILDDIQFWQVPFPVNKFWIFKYHFPKTSLIK